MQGGAGRTQPGPDVTVGGKVWALTGSVTKALPLLELEAGGLQRCVMSARPAFPMAQGTQALRPSPNPLLAATGGRALCRARGCAGHPACGAQKLSQCRGPS